LDEEEEEGLLEKIGFEDEEQRLKAKISAVVEDKQDALQFNSLHSHFLLFLLQFAFAPFAFSLHDFFQREPT